MQVLLSTEQYLADRFAFFPSLLAGSVPEQ
jgi:hypothetical protein